MERYSAVPFHEGLVCRPSAAALTYGEQVAPLETPVSAITPAEPAIEVASTPKSDSHTQELPALSTQDSLARIRAPYEEYLLYLTWALAQMNHPAPMTDDTPDNVPLSSEFPAICTYFTSLGQLSFPELVERSRRYAASVLHHSYQFNQADIEDGLQAGYLRLWQRLQEQPELLADKSLAWIGKGIIYTTLHATRGDWQFRRRTDDHKEMADETLAGSGSSGTFAAHSRDSRHADMRVDIQHAIAAVAEHILKEKEGKCQQHDWWALYGLTVLQVSASEMSRLFHVREQSMQAAYRRVREQLRDALPGYAPVGTTKPVRQHGRTALPRQDTTTIRKTSKDVSEQMYRTVKNEIEVTNADTRQQDELALDGIYQKIPASVQARTYSIAPWRMRRAYNRVSLIIAAQGDPTVRVLRPERRVQTIFTLTAESATAVEQLALEFLKQPKCYEKLVALHAHISNLAISTTARHFHIPTSTLRYYAQQIGTRLHTPIRPAREAKTGPLATQLDSQP